MDYKEFLAELKTGKPRPLYIFLGEEDYLKEHCAEEAKKRLTEPAFEDFNYMSYSEIPDFSECNSFVSTLPMMGERKLLIFRRCGFFTKNFKQKADWEEMLTQLPPHVCVLLWEDELEPRKKKSPPPLLKACEKVAPTVNFSLQTKAQLVPWLARQAAAGGKLIDRACAEYTIESLGRSMSVLKTEMQKIIAYTAGEQISRADIDAVIIRPTEEITFKLLDAFLDGRRDLAYSYISLMREQRIEPVSFLSLLAGDVMLCYRAKLHLGEGLQRSAVVKALGGMPWKAEKCADRARRSSEEKLEGLIELCFEADKGIKQGRILPWTALETITAEMRI